MKTGTEIDQKNQMPYNEPASKGNFLCTKVAAFLEFMPQA